MNIKEIIDAQRWDCFCIGHKQHNSSLDSIKSKVGERIKELEGQLNAFKLKELASQHEPSTWYDDALKRRVKACEEKLEVRDRLVLSLRGRIADLERENARLREKIIIKAT